MNNNDPQPRPVVGQPPETIWLQWHGDQAHQDGEPEDVTWCAEKIFPHDIEYAQAATIARLREELEKQRRLFRWNIEENERGIRICTGEHEKSHDCQFVQHVPEYKLKELRDCLEQFTKAAYPVSAEINARGHNWSETWLDEALIRAAKLLAAHRTATAHDGEREKSK